MDNGLFLCRDEPWAYVDLTTLKEFAPRFVDHLLATASSPEKTPWLEPFRPFRRLLENYSKAVQREDYFDREIGLGRLFGLIDMFNLLGESS